MKTSEVFSQGGKKGRGEAVKMNEDSFVDIIREVINIGIGEAADSLSKLVNARVIIKVPDICIMEARDIDEYVSNELTSLGVYMSQDFSGQLKGRTLLFYTEDCSVSLLNAIYGETIKSQHQRSPKAASPPSMRSEISSWFSCMTQIIEFVGGRLFFDLPKVTVEVSEHYFQNLLKGLGELDKAVVIKNEMCIKGTDIQGYLFVLLNFEDFNLLLDYFGRQKKARPVKNNALSSQFSIFNFQFSIFNFQFFFTSTRWQ